MAGKPRKKLPKADARTRDATLAALRVRGFTSVDHYRDFCRENGLSTRLDKSALEIEQERRMLRERGERRLLEEKRKFSRNPMELVKRIRAGELDGAALPPEMETVRRAFQTVRPELREHLLNLLTAVARRGDLLSGEHGVPAFGNFQSNTYSAAVCALATHAGTWVRHPDTWRPSSHNLKRQFAGLARHLLAKYPVPSFMDSVFFEGAHDEATRHQCWFWHLGAGKNIRAADIPVTMTSKMAHAFNAAPGDLSVTDAIRWGQVRGVGGDARLARAILATRLKEHFENDEFWSSVFVFLAANPMLDPAWIGPMIDWLQFIRFSDNAPEPAFTMKGRTVQALLRRVEEWHATLSRARRTTKAEWAPSGFEEWDHKQGKAGDDDWNFWSIHELLSAKELDEEGAAMRHCVGTYDHSCSSGRASIWSLRRQDKKGTWRVLTIEVQNKMRRIVQARGRMNAYADAEGVRMMKLWAAKARLEMAGHM